METLYDLGLINSRLDVDALKPPLSKLLATQARLKKVSTQDAKLSGAQDDKKILYGFYRTLRTHRHI